MIMKKPFMINGLEMSSSYQVNPLQNHLLYNQLFVEASFLNIPFSIQQEGQWISGSGLSVMFSRSFQFDRREYINTLRKSLGDKYNPEQFLENWNDPVELLKKQAEILLLGELNSVNQKFGGLLKDKIGSIGQIKDLMEMDSRSIAASLLDPSWVEQISQKQALLSEWKTAIKNGRKLNLEDLANIENEITRYNGIKELLVVIESHKAKWKSSGLINKIRQSSLLRELKLKSIIKDPNTVIHSARQYLNLNNVQRLFLKITKLDLGRTVPSFSNLSAGNVLVNGINVQFQPNSKSFGILAGVKQAFNSVNDLPFMNGNISGGDDMLIGIFLGKGGSGQGGNNISLISYRSSNNGRNPMALIQAAPRSGIVLGFNKKLDLGHGGHLDLEVSKSSTRFLNDESDSVYKKSVSSRLLGNGSFFSNLAISADYKGVFSKIKLDVGLRVRYAGIEYNNPATSFLGAGGSELTASFRKTFYKNRLTILVRNTTRQHSFGNAQSLKWTSQYLMTDIRWKFRKAQYISIRYQPSRSFRVLDGNKETVLVNDQLTLNGLFGRKWRRLLYRSNINLSYAKMQTPFLSDTLDHLSNNLQISVAQSLSAGTKSFFLNTSFSDVSRASSFIFFNTTFLSDMGVSYLVGKVSLSSSISYQSVKGWYQQIGIRQMASGNVGKRISLNLFVDMGKSIKIDQPLPYSLVRADCSLHYSLGKLKNEEN